MKNIEHNLPVTLQQIINWVRQCTPQEKKIIISELLDESKELSLASEKSLAKDWLSEEEDNAWKNL
ncbi:MAG: hypothetical protein ABIT08_17055 [Bacteroidia bacterium]